MELRIYLERTQDQNSWLLSQDGIATSSVLGCLDLGKDPEDKKVVILFETKSLGWHEKNGGPPEVIVPWYSMKCLAKDIVWLCNQGYEVEIGQFFTE